MRILVAIDGSETSEAAVDEIAQRNLPPNSEVRVISVIETAYSSASYSGGAIDIQLYEGMESASRDGASAAVETAAAKLREGGKSNNCSVTTQVLSGSPKGVILEEAEAFGADLIVVGSHGHGMLERFLLGSVSQAVALHAKCSVEIVRKPQTKTSGSKHSD